MCQVKMVWEANTFVRKSTVQEFSKIYNRAYKWIFFYVRTKSSNRKLKNILYEREMNHVTVIWSINAERHNRSRIIIILFIISIVI